MIEQVDNALAKMNRINMLYDFYEPLLTDKQRTFLSFYFHDNYSLSEIAEQFSVSRQAVYEHVKRAETVLEQYEDKLQLIAKHEHRKQLILQIQRKLDLTLFDEQTRLLLDELISGS